MSRRMASMVALTVLATAACSSGNKTPAESTPQARSSTTLGSRSSSTIGSRTLPSFDSAHGVVSATCNGGVTLVVSDPSTGTELATRAFPLQAGLEASFSCDSIHAHPWAFRQNFDSTYSLLAVSFEKEDDGSSHVGYLDAQGRLTDITAVTRDRSAFSSAPQHVLPVFHPTRPEVWFLDISSRHIQSFDVNTEKLTDWDEVGTDDPIYKHAADSYRFFVTATDWILRLEGNRHDLSAAQDYMPHPEGRLLMRHRVATIYDQLSVVRLESQKAPLALESNDPFIQADCAPRSWIDELRILCQYGGGSSLTVVSFDPTYREATRADLLPPSDRTNRNAVVAPTRDRILFTSEQGNSKTVFAVPLGGAAAEPERLYDVELDRPRIEWR